jgi:hypothetical protein
LPVLFPESVLGTEVRVLKKFFFSLPPFLFFLLLQVLRFLATTTNEQYLAAGVNIFKRIATHGNDAQIDACLDANALEAVIQLLDNAGCELVENVCCFLANVVCGTQAQIQKVIDSGCLREVVNVGC